MKSTSHTAENHERQRLESALRAVLPPMTQVRTAHASGSGVQVKVNGRRLRVRWAGEGWLRQIRRILDDTGHRPDVVVARRMSPGAREALGRAGIGWVDESGAAEVALGSLIVSRTGRPSPPPKKPTHWTPAVVAVAESLLCGIRATVAETQAVTGLSKGSCANALRVLTDLGLLVAGAARGPGSARRVVDTDELLDAYASNARALAPSKSLQVGVTWQDAIVGLAEVGRKFDAADVDWAATGTVASMAMAPFLTNVASADVYVGATTVAELEAVAEKIGLRVIEGGRLTLRPFPTATTARLASTVEGLRVAPWPRVYADLRDTGVRGEEVAEHLREVTRER